MKKITLEEAIGGGEIKPAACSRKHHHFSEIIISESGGAGPE